MVVRLSILPNAKVVWQELLYNEFMKHNTLSQVTTNPTNSQILKSIMRVKGDFFDKGSFIIDDNLNKWKPLCYPSTTPKTSS
jgi:hypothetical protein